MGKKRFEKGPEEDEGGFPPGFRGGRGEPVETAKRDFEGRTEQVLSEEDREQLRMQQEIIEQLQTAKNCESRVRIFAKLMDTYGLDAILSLFPGAPEALVNVISGLYLLHEAEKAGLSKTDYLKIVSLQAADFFVGAVPIAGDIADIFFKANKWSVPLFQKRTDELIAEARKAGVSEKAIAKIVEPAETLPRLVDHTVNLHQRLKKRMAA